MEKYCMTREQLKIHIQVEYVNQYHSNSKSDILYFYSVSCGHDISDSEIDVFFGNTGFTL